MNIGNFEIGSGRVFVIAEIGNNHNGSLERAIKMVDMAISMGADAVKFQMRNLAKVYRSRSLMNQGEDLGTEYILDLLRKFELTEGEHRKICEYCRLKGILYLCTPWDDESVEILEDMDVKAYKVASADLTNLPLIKRLCETKKPLILSTGMSSLDEVNVTVDLLKKYSTPFILLHCNSTYPAPFHDIHLNWMRKLREISSLVGYSGHERGTAVPIGAVALGASMIERHFTLSREMEGPDHAASLEFDEFSSLIKGIRELEQALGDGLVRVVSQGEMINRENLAKSLVSARKIKAGSIIQPEDIKVRSPGQGLSPQFYENLLGRKIERDMEEEDFFYRSDIGLKLVEPQKYKFKRPWGVPVRYHDYEDFRKRINPDLYEFHLSYLDMELDPADYILTKDNANFIVHAPELFAGSKLMDLTSPDEAYRISSVHETQRVVDITRNLKKFFPLAKRPCIVANIGGHTMDGPLNQSEIGTYYHRFEKSLSELNLNGVELLPQTMAPFPWHFGGQRFQNLFMRSADIVSWCQKLNLRVCLDVSHSYLMCNYFKEDFYEFCKLVAPHAHHLHIGDASGVNGEGLQIGDGEIDFKLLAQILNDSCVSASFIPEIWQGHKNQGEGFWIALNRLTGIF